MLRALQIASRGQGYVEPNPQVGCVIAIGEQVLAEGWHHAFGEAHAEVDALGRLSPGSDLSQATAYVTLEPCCHTGKTPPCTQAILNARIPRVVVAVEDPFPQVAGRGLEQLRAAGVEVVTGVCETEGVNLLAPYLKLLQHRNALDDREVGDDIGWKTGDLCRRQPMDFQSCLTRAGAPTSQSRGWYPGR